MKKYIRLVTAFTVFTFLFFDAVNAQQHKIEGGSEMLSNHTIIENAANSKDHTILVRAIYQADLDLSLEENGSYTLFAPTNEAFELQPETLITKLFSPKEVENLQAVLYYHVLPRSYTTKALKRLVRKHNGAAKIATVNGDQLLFSIKKRKLVITDYYGNNSIIMVPDIAQRNGVMHVVNNVMIPKFNF